MILFMATFTALTGYGLGIGLVTLMIYIARYRLPNYAAMITFFSATFVYVICPGSGDPGPPCIRTMRRLPTIGADGFTDATSNVGPAVPASATAADIVIASIPAQKKVRRIIFSLLDGPLRASFGKAKLYPCDFFWPCSPFAPRSAPNPSLSPAAPISAA